MKKLTNDELKAIKGGTSITGSLINAFINLFELLKESGQSIGSAIRRISDGNICRSD